MKDTILSIRTAASLIREVGLTTTDIQEFCEICPTLGQKLDEIQNWINGNKTKTVINTPAPAVVKTTPVVEDEEPWLHCGAKGTEWRRAVTGHAIMVSNEGEFFDLLEKKLLEPVVVRGHVSIPLFGHNIHVDSIVASTFEIYSPKNAVGPVYIIHKDNDIRNVKPENLERVVDKDACIAYKSAAGRDILDVSNMILKHKGIVDEIMMEYPEQRRTGAFKDYIIRIRDLMEGADISSMIFTNIGGEIIPTDPEGHTTEETPEGLDIVGLLFSTKDVTLACNMIENKVKDNVPLTSAETAILVYTFWGKGFKSAPKIREKISADYGITIPPKQISLILNNQNKTSIIEKIREIIIGG